MIKRVLKRMVGGDYCFTEFIDARRGGRVLHTYTLPEVKAIHRETNRRKEPPAAHQRFMTVRRNTTDSRGKKGEKMGKEDIWRDGML